MCPDGCSLQVELIILWLSVQYFPKRIRSKFKTLNLTFVVPCREIQLFPKQDCIKLNHETPLSEEERSRIAQPKLDRGRTCRIFSLKSRKFLEAIFISPKCRLRRIKTTKSAEEPVSSNLETIRVDARQILYRGNWLLNTVQALQHHVWLESDNPYVFLKEERKNCQGNIRQGRKISFSIYGSLIIRGPRHQNEFGQIEGIRVVCSSWSWVKARCHICKRARWNEFGEYECLSRSWRCYFEDGIVADRVAEGGIEALWVLVFESQSKSRITRACCGDAWANAVSKSLSRTP